MSEDELHAARRAIRRAALALFKSRGYAATTVEQIAQAADVAPMTVYRYFGTKEATVVSVSLTPALREGLGRMADALASDGAPTVAEVSGLVALLAAEEADWLESLAVRGELVASTPELEQALWAQSSAWTTTLAEQLPTEALSARVQARALAGACLEGLLAWRDRSAFPDADSLVDVIQEALNAIRVPTSIPAP